MGKPRGFWTDTDTGSKMAIPSVMPMVSMEFHPTPVGRTAISESGFVFGPGDSRREAQAHNEIWRYVTHHV